MPTYIEPFNLRLILVNYFLGSTNLFAYAFVIMFAYVSAKYQMPDKYFLLLLAVGSLMFSVYIGESLLLVFLIIIGFVTFKALAGMIQK